MRVLIIGGTGLISTGIVKALQGRNADITVFNRGKTDNRLPESVRQMHGNRDEPGALTALANEPRFDAVIDMICFNPEQAKADIATFAGKTEHFVFCSTVCTYGNTQTDVPTHEGIAQRPVSTYGKNKVLCEELFNEAHANKKFAVTIFRPSHTFGPGGGIINNLGWNRDFVDRLRKGRPIIISGDGHGLWQSAYADDVGVGFAHALGRRSTFGEAYNIVGPEFFTWDQYTQRTAQAIGAPEPNITHIPTDALLAINAKRFVAIAEIFRYHGIYDNTKILRDIPEYRPGATPFEEGVRHTVAWMDKHHTIEPCEKDPFEDRLVESWNKWLQVARREMA